MGSGKGSTSTSTVSIPPQVLAQYQNVNNIANQTASTPYKAYSGEMVAPVNAQEQTGINATNTAANSYQPYYSAATNATMNGGQAVNPTALDSNAINQYMSPYLNTVLGSESALLNQNNQQQQSGQMGTAISSGAFGGDRSGIAAANLAQQQNLANSSIYSNILNTGYNNALGAAQQQQGVNLSAQQANRTAQQQMGSQLAGLGTAYQTAGLTGAAAQTAAGQLQQQTQQASDTANMNQYLQGQSYPFQVAQFLASIAEGTGSLSGSTTSTNSTQNGIFSDRRLKSSIHKVGKTFDGQDIYTYKYKGHPETHMGLMAQDVEHHEPDAVGLASGYKTVDYEKATDKAAKRGHFAAGGAPAWQDILANYQNMYGGLLGSSGGINSGTIVPQSQGQSHSLAVAQPKAAPQENLLHDASSLASDVDTIGKAGDKGGLWSYGGKNPESILSDPDSDPIDGSGNPKGIYARGGHVRTGLAAGGDPDADLPYQIQGPQLDIPDDKQAFSLNPAKPPSQSGSNGAMGDIADAAKIASLFMAARRGGRIQRADGGGVDGQPNISAIRKALLIALNPMLQHQGADPAPSDAANDTGVDSQAIPQKMVANGSHVPSGLGSAPSMGDDGDEDDSSAVSGSPTRTGHLDPQIVSFLKSNGLGTDQAKGIAAGVYAESANNPDAVNPKSGALGLGQWLGSRKKGLVSQFGDNPTKEQQLGYLLSELNGGDPGGKHVLAADDAPTALAAYIQKFMRPAKGAETTGDMARGLGALRQGFADGGTPEDDAPDDFLPDAPDSLAIPEGLRKVALAASRDAGPDSIPPVSDPAPQIAANTPKESNKPEGLLPAGFSDPVSDMDSTRGLASTPLPDATAAPSKPSSDDNGDETKGGFWHNLKSGKADAIIPLLTGFAAFGTANTKNPFTALATGLGAGAQQYQKQREFELEPQQLGINRMTATAGVYNAQNQAANQARIIAMNLYDPVPTNPVTPWYNKTTGKYETDQQHQSTIDNAVKTIYSRQIPGLPALQMPSLSGGDEPSGPTSAGDVAPNLDGSATPADVAQSNAVSEPSAAAPAHSTGAPAHSPLAPTTAAMHSPLPHDAPANARAKNGEYNGQSIQNAIPPIDDRNVPDANKISTLQANYERLRDAGRVDAANAVQQQIQAINSGHQIVLDNNGQQFQGYAQHQHAIDAAKATYDAKVAQRNKEVAGAQKFVGDEYPTTMNALKTMATNSSLHNMNRGSEDIANFVGTLRSIPGVGHAFDSLAGMQGANDEQKKLAVSQALQQSGLSDAPATVLREALLTVASPTIDPAARYGILTRQMAMLNKQYDYSKDLLGNQNNVVDTSSYQNDWNSERRHSLDNYVAHARASTPYSAGMTQDQQAEQPKPGKAPDLSGATQNQRVITPQGVMYYDQKTGLLFKNPR